MLEVVKDSDIDYLIWFAPYKYTNTIFKIRLPKAVVLDVKKIKYDRTFYLSRKYASSYNK